MITKERRVKYVQRLKRMNIQLLGDGFNSHVFQHPLRDDVAVKIVDADDTVYFKYLNWARKNIYNPYVPRILHITMIDCINGHGYGVVFLEKLEEISTVDYNNFINELGCDPDNITTADVITACNRVADDYLRALLYFLSKRPKSLDLHQANFMTRGKQVVFIDPFVN